MLSNIFKWVNAIPRITRILSNSKIQVCYKGDGAYTSVDEDGKPVVINLPAFPDNISQKHLDLTFGFMFHELGHVNYTDFSVAKKNNIDIQSGVGQMFNIIEDTFVEKSISPDFLEAKQYLLHCQNYIIDYTLQALNKSGIKNNEKAIIMLIPKIRYLAGQSAFGKIVSEYPVKELNFLDKYENDIKNVSSTQDSYDLAVKIYQDLKKNVKFPNQSKNTNAQQGSGSSKQNSSHQNNSSNSSSSKESNESGSEKDSQNNSSQNTEDGKNEGSNNGADDKENNAGGNNKNNGSNEDESGLKEALSRAVANSDAFKEIRARNTTDKTNKVNGGNDNDNKPSGPCTILKDFNNNVYTVIDRSKDGFWEVPTEYDSHTVDKMMPNVSILSMKQKLLRLFAAKSKKSIIKGVRSGKLCNSNLFRLKLNDNRVFKKNYENTQLNTAITLLIDCSGSMSGGRDQCAISAAFLFARILEHLNIPCEVLGFSTGPEHFYGTRGRNVSVKNAIFKTFKEKLTPKVVGRFCYFYNGKNHENYYNCNDDGESILLALSNLANRTEDRKMLFVLSDGQPNVGGCDGEEYNHLKDVIKSIEETNGFEIYGIGIQTNAVRKFYSNYSVLDNPEDLSKIIIQQLSKNIL